MISPQQRPLHFFIFLFFLSGVVGVEEVQALLEMYGKQANWSLQE